MRVSGVAPVALGFAVAVQSAYINYTSVPGYFLQDDENTDHSTFDFTTTNFGLIDRTYDVDKKTKNDSLTQWERFYNQVVELNDNAPSNVDYKVLFLGRHGQGWHNVGETYYGTPAWNCYWSLLNGNGTVTWRDSELTDTGIDQVRATHVFWQKQIDTQRIHTPDNYFVSPLRRTLQTANHTFSDLVFPKGSAIFKPLIHELFREIINTQTCNSRHTRTYVNSLFPDWPIDPSVSEKDELWNRLTAETDEPQDFRSRKALEAIFASPRNQTIGPFVSVTSHTMEITSLLRVLGHRPFSLNTGGVIPVLVRAETVSAPSPTMAPWSTSSHCTAPPVTSLSECVCASGVAPVTTPLMGVTATATAEAKAAV